MSRQTEPTPLPDRRLVRVVEYSDGLVEMGTDPEDCERHCGCSYDRQLFAECPKCRALRRVAAKKRDDRLMVALVHATDGGPQH